ncbi:MAG: hypothetical protein WAV92_06515 [Halopseudomonas yangmingensis]|uniref:Uncharacterized protein n=1 Tax=Halopseudomonas yangmingensis TaxID=1720063 RepID=A0A1I4TWE6_9GAMM|nr:hypothetical protein [Halopseudomonas yangmingensis]SFM80873.1 hypothetical protein SAMN05216217_11650 [Halopseudomonas yangmingensis]
MHRIYLDTEFTSLTLERKLISLALVSSTGDECYVELSEGWTLDDCSEFVVETVLPLLDIEQQGLTRRDAAEQVRIFLLAQGEAVIVGDALHWDWPLLTALLAPKGLPDNIRGCREVDDPLGHLPPEHVPHHALLDARLLHDLCEQPDQAPDSN